MTQRRNRSGVRISGDNYHFLVAWIEALDGLANESTFDTLELEADAPAGIDDIVVRLNNGEKRYIQAKYATDHRTLVNAEWLFHTEKPTARSILQKLYNGWLRIRTDSNTQHIELVTNRAVDPNDPVLSLLDARDDSLRRVLDQPTPRSTIGQALAGWADHLAVSQEDLADFLRVTEWQTARHPTLLAEIAQARMAALGLSPSDQALEAGITIMRKLVTEDHGPLTPTVLRTRTTDIQQLTSKPDALVVIEAIDRDPAAPAADYGVDWQRHYPQPTVDDRITPTGGGATYETMWTDLTNLREQLQDDGIRRILLRGTFRLASWFAAGRALRSVDGFEVTIQRGPALVDSATTRSNFALRPTAHAIDDQGTDLAVAIALSLDPTHSIRSFLHDSALSIETLHVISPTTRAAPNILQSDADALAAVFDAREHIRHIAASTRHVHLFLACTAPVAALLGHYWHRIAPVTVYEHTGPSYAPAFSFPA